MNKILQDLIPQITDAVKISDFIDNNKTWNNTK